MKHSSTTSPESLEDKQKAKDQILHLLKTQGAQTATTLSEQLQVSPMAVRQHLQVLQAEQWVTYQEERRPLGRPVKLWQLTERSLQLFPDSHADLMTDLLLGVETLFGTAGLEKLLADRMRRQLQTYATKLPEAISAAIAESTWQEWIAQAGIAEPVQHLAHLRTQEGYMAEVLEAEGGWLLVENHCPICAAAQTCQKLCGSELEMFRTLLGSGVAVERVEHIIQGDRRCAYRIQPA
ncbi:transcriptional regulator [Trichocoleus sp. FACHB-591]|uniref:helix-turn-helix transcriptional regulator n=1 Tax=Trichocoleus sp. FACHB-591 TaxID=2692872 RepID=UPI001683D8C0|nr:metalloregulator ArsR/SmtB family transcription factor [Trichocoleus sp. FACHB-591]MBD2096792.1 transcriptional regulator [Trichocoleus sp. FACHB-591]